MILIILYSRILSRVLEDGHLILSFFSAIDPSENQGNFDDLFKEQGQNTENKTQVREGLSFYKGDVNN